VHLNPTFGMKANFNTRRGKIRNEEESNEQLIKHIPLQILEQLFSSQIHPTKIITEGILGRKI
jgi:hypothetical protein